MQPKNTFDIPGRCQPDQPLGEQARRVRTHRRECVVITEPLGADAHRLGELDPAVADVHAPESRHAVDVAAPVDVLNAGTAARTRSCSASLIARAGRAA